MLRRSRPRSRRSNLQSEVVEQPSLIGAGSSVLTSISPSAVPALPLGPAGGLHSSACALARLWWFRLCQRSFGVLPEQIGLLRLHAGLPVKAEQNGDALFEFERLVRDLIDPRRCQDVNENIPV